MSVVRRELRAAAHGTGANAARGNGTSAAPRIGPGAFDAPRRVVACSASGKNASPWLVTRLSSA